MFYSSCTEIAILRFTVLFGWTMGMGRLTRKNLRALFNATFLFTLLIQLVCCSEMRRSLSRLSRRRIRIFLRIEEIRSHWQTTPQKSSCLRYRIEKPDKRIPTIKRKLLSFSLDFLLSFVKTLWHQTDPHCTIPRTIRFQVYKETDNGRTKLSRSAALFGQYKDYISSLPTLMPGLWVRQWGGIVIFWSRKICFVGYLNS